MSKILLLIIVLFFSTNTFAGEPKTDYSITVIVAVFAVGAAVLTYLIINESSKEKTAPSDETAYLDDDNTLICRNIEILEFEISQLNQNKNSFAANFDISIYKKKDFSNSNMYGIDFSYRF